MEDIPGVTHYLKVFIAIFILVNPFEGIPFFLSATETMPPQDRHRVARRAAIGVTIILLTSLVLGRLILGLFGITTPAFQTAGLEFLRIGLVRGTGEDVDLLTEL